MEQQIEQTAKEVSNNDVKVQVHRRPHCRIEYEVHAFPSIVQSSYRKAIRAISKEVSLPGFRKGKAPDALVIKNYPSQLDKAWQEEIANEAFQAAQKLAQVPLLNGNAKVTFQMKSHSFENGADLSLFFETEPEIPNIDASKIQFQTVNRAEINEEKIDEMIRQLQFFFAEWKHVNDRPVQEGDFVLLDVETIEQTPPVPVFSATRFEVRKKSMAEWMYNLILGQNVGATLEGTSVPDEKATAEEKEANPPRKVRVHIRALEEATVSPLDDEFAVKLGVQNLSDLRTALSKHLNKMSDDHYQEALREQVNEFILTQYPFDLPASLVEKETYFRMKQLLNDPQFKKQWEALNEAGRKQMLDSVYFQSEKAVRMFYICRKIVKDANITINPQDLPPPPATLLELLLKPQEDMYAAGHHNAEVKQAEAFSRLLLERAQDHVISQAPK